MMGVLTLLLRENQSICRLFSSIGFRVSTNFTFFSDRIVYMILRGQTSPNTKKKKCYF